MTNLLFSTSYGLVAGQHCLTHKNQSIMYSDYLNMNAQIKSVYYVALADRGGRSQDALEARAAHTNARGPVLVRCLWKVRQQAAEQITRRYFDWLMVKTVEDMGFKGSLAWRAGGWRCLRGDAATEHAADLRVADDTNVDVARWRWGHRREECVMATARTTDADVLQLLRLPMEEKWIRRWAELPAEGSASGKGCCRTGKGNGRRTRWAWCRRRLNLELGRRRRGENICDSMEWKKLRDAGSLRR